MLKSKKIQTPEDPFEILDQLMPPERPTKQVTDEKWKRLTSGIKTD